MARQPRRTPRSSRTTVPERTAGLDSSPMRSERIPRRCGRMMGWRLVRGSGPSILQTPFSLTATLFTIHFGPWLPIGGPIFACRTGGGGPLPRRAPAETPQAPPATVPNPSLIRSSVAARHLGSLQSRPACFLLGAATVGLCGRSRRPVPSRRPALADTTGGGPQQPPKRTIQASSSKRVPVSKLRSAMSEQLDPLMQKLIARLQHDDPVTRRNAAGALRLHGSRAAVAIPELSRLLSDEDSRVRQEARRALERLRNAAA